MIDIITPVFNHSKETIDCIRSIKKNTTVPFRWVYVDNGSKSVEFKKIMATIEEIKLPHLVIKNKENLGFVKATNQGLRQNKNDFVALLNNDTIVCPGWLSEQLSVMLNDAKIGIASCLTTNSAYQGIDRIGILLKQNIPQDPAYIKKHFKGQYIDRGGISFQCAMFRQEMVDEIGLLDEAFLLGLGDDDEYCARARIKYGWKIALALGGFIFHLRRTTFRDIKGYEKEQERNLKLYKTIHDKYVREAQEKNDLR